MPKPYLLRKPPRGLGSPAMRRWTAAILTVCVACLSGCAGSSSNTVAMNGGAGDSSAAGYNSEGVLASTPTSSATAFAPTAAAIAANSSAASQAADELTAVAKPGNAAYKIGPLDVLDVSVFKVPDLNKTVQVAENGTINYPLLGDVPAAGQNRSRTRTGSQGKAWRQISPRPAGYGDDQRI